MKAETLKERPEYELLKQNDIVSFFNYQLPRWLFEDSRYINMSLEAKVTYALLFNRFQLSKHNGWINEDGEVFVVYTRKELSDKLNVGEKRISAAMNELKDYELIWERRCGRGFANQIYLASVKISLNDALKAKGGPLDAPDASRDESADVSDAALCNETKTDDTAGDSRTVETAVLENCTPEPAQLQTDVESKRYPDYKGTAGAFSAEAPPNLGAPEPPKHNFQNRQNGVSKPAGSAAQEPPNPPPSYLDLRFKDFSILNHSQSTSSPPAARAWTDSDSDAGALSAIIAHAELEVLDEKDAVVIRDAIERLYFTQSINIGNAVYPNVRIRSNLQRLDASVIQSAVDKITSNCAAKIRNSSAYVTTVLFNTIMESGSDLLVDPYLNSLRAAARGKIATNNLRQGCG
jgi:hypothetical protein